MLNDLLKVHVLTQNFELNLPASELFKRTIILEHNDADLGNRIVDIHASADTMEEIPYDGDGTDAASFCLFEIKPSTWSNIFYICAISVGAKSGCQISMSRITLSLSLLKL